MKVNVQQGQLEKFACDLLVLKWVQGQKMDGSTGVVDKALNGLIPKIMKENGFKGKEGEIMLFPIFDKKIAAKKVMVLGLGEQENVTVDLLRRSAARIVKVARQERAKRVGMIFIGTGTAEIDPYTAAKAITEGALLGGYTYLKYKSKEDQENIVFPEALSIVFSGVHEKATGNEKEKLRAAELGIRDGALYADATIFARDMVNAPSSIMTPKTLADIARSLALTLPSPRGRGVGGEGTIEANIFNKAQIEKMKMGAYLGVAKGSDHDPYLIHLTWRPPCHPERREGSLTLPKAREEISRFARNDGISRIAIIGKGITFDSGGLSLKPASAMESMKTDMAGCAAMLGVFHALVKMKPDVEVHGISAVCENMPSGKAMKPGDIVHTMNGKTIEVLNTDAEGRLTLVDALTYTIKNIQPDAIVDVATLTGACIVALGEEVAAYMGNNRELLDQVKKAAEDAGEMLWELPLVKEYKESIKSHIADYCNITPGRKGAGTITAGLLLAEFVGKTPWVHIDIAGPSWEEHDVIPYLLKGGTGFGVRTLLELIKNLK